MITNENLAALPGMVALTPASAWVAATGLVVLAAVIILRLSLKRKPPVKRVTDVLDEEFWLDVLFGVDKNSGPEKCDEKHGRGNLLQEKRSDYSKEHVP